MNDGGSAFPEITTLSPNEREGRDYAEVISSGGMSLRDYFAAKALIGFLNNEANSVAVIKASLRDGGDHHEAHRRFARDAYQLADAMLAEREKKGAS